MKYYSVFRKEIVLALTIAAMGCAGPAPKPEASAVLQGNGATTPSATARSIASEPGFQREMENRYQAIMAGEVPEQDMIHHIDRLFYLLIEVNKGIDTFGDDLDQKLALRKQDPNAEIEDPLMTPNYRRMMKMWQLKDRYTTEVSYFYLRLLEARRSDNGLPEIERKKARQVLKSTEKHLAGAFDLKRVELQDLMHELQEIFIAFVKEHDVARRAEGANKRAEEWLGRVAPNPMVTEAGTAPPIFEKALFASPGVLQTYIRDHRIQSVPKFTGREKKVQEDFLSEINRDLSLIADPILERAERVPQSTQDLACGGSKKLCAATTESGNIVGAIFPKGVWAFTYDDGPAAESTGNLMELLRDHRDSVNPVGKATFFWLAKKVRSYPQWVKKGFDYGFSLQNHSFSHADLNRSTTNRSYEVNESNAVLTEEFHKVDPSYVIQYFRCPYGSCYAPKIPEVRQMIADQGQIHVYWRIDSLDWKLLNGPKVADLVIKQMQLQNHGVILMHDIHPTTVEATRLILKWLKDQNDNHGGNYRMVTIPEAVNIVNGVFK